MISGGQDPRQESAGSPQPVDLVLFGSLAEGLKAARFNGRVRIGWPPISVGPSRIVTTLELALAVSGIGLGIFLVMHTGLLLSSILGAAAMDGVASLFERYYLLQTVTPLLILLILAHVILASRKLPIAAQEQLALTKYLGTLWHFDTWLWVIQIATGIGLLALISIHLWEVLTDLPIEAVKSAGRVRETYLTFSLPFAVLVQAHLPAGLYRIAVKWGLMERRWARVAVAVWIVLFLGLDMAIVVSLRRIGGGA